LKIIENSKPELLLSICVAEDEFSKLGILFPVAAIETVEKVCEMFGNSYSTIQKVLKNFSLPKKPNAYIEFMVLREGFGFGVYQEGFNAIFHFSLEE